MGKIQVSQIGAVQFSKEKGYLCYTFQKGHWALGNGHWWFTRDLLFLLFSRLFCNVGIESRAERHCQPPFTLCFNTGSQQSVQACLELTLYLRQALNSWFSCLSFPIDEPAGLWQYVLLPLLVWKPSFLPEVLYFLLGFLCAPSVPHEL